MNQLHGVKIQKGFTLIELMIASVLGIVITMGMFQLLLASKRTFQFHEQMSIIQENARFILKEFATPIRNASGSFANCTSASKTSNATWDTGANAPNSAGVSLGLRGYIVSANDANNESFLVNAHPGTDSLSVSTINIDNSLTVTAHDAQNGIFTVSAPHSIPEETVMAAISPSCDQISIFNVTGPLTIFNAGDGGTASNIHNRNNTYNFGDPATLTNCSNYLHGNFTCSGPKEANIVGVVEAKSFAPGTKLMTMSSDYYYIADSAINDIYGDPYPALFLNGDELTQGVEDINLLFGVDSDSDKVANQYLSPDNVNDADWEKVVTVRVELILRSLEKTLDTGDRFVRKTISKTYQIRNRGI
ncbi:MAG: PilW family protein [Saccharospirillaceae bacterium]|nr:PilW family protein [Pseudomonadales bacterium]NRB79268.1 PilW family protein [Saccharospirillaceae bacterium]